MKRMVIISLIFLTCVSFPWGRPVHGWSGKTHVFIARMSGMLHPESAVFADLQRTEQYALLGPYHYYNAAPGIEITEQTIWKQKQSIQPRLLRTYGRQAAEYQIAAPPPSGVLYYHIIDLFDRMTQTSKLYRTYYLAQLAHFVGDLSQPLHNFPYGSERASDGKRYKNIGSWHTPEMHWSFDSALDTVIPRLEPLCFDLEADRVNSQQDLIRHVVTIATRTCALAQKCYNGSPSRARRMTVDEAVAQVKLSIRLLKGILEYESRLPASGHSDQEIKMIEKYMQ